MWVWGLTNVESPDDAFEWGKDIAAFCERMSQHNATVYFHNLGFDGRFIIDWLLKNGFEHAETSGIIGKGVFKSLISDMGKFYSITVRWESGHTTEFRDSYKKLPMAVSRIATSFQLGESKGELDYDLPRPIGWEPTAEELDYLRRDVVIVAKALQQALDSGMKKMTVASDSMTEYKRTLGSLDFTNLFPQMSMVMDAEIRRAYRGGFTYDDPRFHKKVVGSGLVLDVNSLYPSVMKDALLPYGEPEYMDGKVLPNARRPLTIFSVTLTAKLKRNHIPCIQIKGTHLFAPTEYLREIREPTTLMMTNVDLALYQDHYNVDILEYGGGWRFKAAVGMFDTYIDKWSQIKAESVGGKREIAKLHLNSLYGKFASNPNVTSKIPMLNENGVVKLVTGRDETRPPVYTAMGVFITSYARDITIRAAQANYSVFAYADTDSLHLLTATIPDALDVHPTRMGAWKHEYNFDAAFYIRPKAYLERHSPSCSCKECAGQHEHFTVRIAGLPEDVSRRLTFEDMRHGKVLHGKLNPQAVPGGVVLRDIPFELKL